MPCPIVQAPLGAKYKHSAPNGARIKRHSKLQTSRPYGTPQTASKIEDVVPRKDARQKADDPITQRLCAVQIGDRARGKRVAAVVRAHTSRRWRGRADSASRFGEV